MAKKKVDIVVKQNDKKELQVPFEVMAESIVNISRFAQQIKNSRLSEDAILALMKDMTHESKATIKRILDGLAVLERTYVRR